jgi:hypothetical protein
LQPSKMVIPENTDPKELVISGDYVPNSHIEEEAIKHRVADSRPARTLSTRQSPSAKSKSELFATSNAVQLSGSEVIENFSIWRPGDFADCKLVAGVRPVAWTSAVLVIHAFLCQNPDLNRNRIWDRVTEPVLRIFWPPSVATFWTQLSKCLQSKVDQVLIDIKSGKLGKSGKKRLLRLTSNKVPLVQVKGIGMRPRSSKRKNKTPVSTLNALGGQPMSGQTEILSAHAALVSRGKRRRPPPGFHALLGLEGRVDSTPNITSSRPLTHQFTRKRKDVGGMKQRRRQPYFLQESNRRDPLPPPPFHSANPRGSREGGGGVRDDRLPGRQSDIFTELSEVASVLYNVAEKLDPSLCQPLESAVRVLEGHHARVDHAGLTPSHSQQRHVPLLSNQFMPPNINNAGPYQFNHHPFPASYSGNQPMVHYPSALPQPLSPPLSSLQRQSHGPYSGMGMLGQPHFSPQSPQVEGLYRYVPLPNPHRPLSQGLETGWRPSGVASVHHSLVTHSSLTPSFQPSVLHQKMDGYSTTSGSLGDVRVIPNLRVNPGSQQIVSGQQVNRGNDGAWQVKDAPSQLAIDLAERLIECLEGYGEAVIIPDALSDSNGKLSVFKFAMALSNLQESEVEVQMDTVVQLLALLGDGNENEVRDAAARALDGCPADQGFV